MRRPPTLARHEGDSASAPEVAPVASLSAIRALWKSMGPTNYVMNSAKIR
jgi:hypothetical protein